MNRLSTGPRSLTSSTTGSDRVVKRIYNHLVAREHFRGPVLDHYLAHGWFRAGRLMHTTSHIEYGALLRVLELRYRIADIGLPASQARIRRRASRFKVVIRPFMGISAEHEDFFQRYLQVVDFGKELTLQDMLFGHFEVDTLAFETVVIKVLDGTQQVALGFFDIGVESAAAIVHCYDPAYKWYSPGKMLFHLTLDWLRDHGYRYYYPGYIAAGNSRFDYKRCLGEAALEYYNPDSEDWQPFSPDILHPEQLPPEQQLEVYLKLMMNEVQVIGADDDSLPSTYTD